MHTGKLALTLLLFKRWLLLPPQKGVTRWLAHFALLSFALAIALLLPVHHSLKAGVYYASGYDYRIASVDETELNSISNQPFLLQKCTLYATSMQCLSFKRHSMRADVKYCQTSDDLDLSWFPSNRFLSSLSPNVLKNQEGYLILDYRLARSLQACTGDFLDIDGFERPLVVGAVCSSIDIYANPPAVVVSDTRPDELVSRELNAETMFVSVSDKDAADHYFSSEYPLLSKDVDDEHRFDIARQALSTRAEDLAAADKGVVNLGLTVVLYVLGCVLVGLYACRTVQQLVSQHRKECVTLCMLGTSRRRLVVMIAFLVEAELLSAVVAAVLPSKVIVEKLTAFKYSMVEQVLFCAPCVTLIALFVVIASGFSCIAYTRFKKGG